MCNQVLINCKWKTHPHVTGVQRYAQELIDALSDTELSFSCAAPDPCAAWRSTVWEQLSLSRRAAGFQTLFCPANSAPIHLATSVQLVLTLHCLRYSFHPENYSRSFVRWYRFMVPRLIERAETVLAVSNTTAKEIIEVYPHARGKIEVIYPGVSGAFGSEGASGDPAIGGEPYWVFIGNAAPAKNLRVVLDALDISAFPHRIVLLGVNNDQLSAIKGANLTDRQQGRVLPLGHINDINRVAAILRGAMGLLAPSRYESFDLPTVEAMASACPVIASDTAVHREIGCDVPVFVKMDDPAQWSKEMDRLSADSLFRRHLGKLGVERASHFCWKDAAARVARILEQPEATNNP
jgi:glycosyltransferase involved in cell wall biosynthesis